MSFTCKYFYVQGLQMVTYINTFPGVPVEIELQKMVAWLDANPERAAKKKNFNRFIVNWLSKCHGRLLEAQVSATTRELVRREQQRVDANVGLWKGYR